MVVVQAQPRKSSPSIPTPGDACKHLGIWRDIFVACLAFRLRPVHFVSIVIFVIREQHQIQDPCIGGASHSLASIERGYMIALT